MVPLARERTKLQCHHEGTRVMALLSSARMLFGSGHSAQAAALVEVVKVNSGHKRENLANGGKRVHVIRCGH